MFANEMGRYELKVTAHQMALLFTWNTRPKEEISFANLRLTTGLTDTELSRALCSLLANPKLPNPILLSDHRPQPGTNGTAVGGGGGGELMTSGMIAAGIPQFTDSTLFWLNQQFAPMKGDKHQSRGKINLIGRLQLTVQEAGGESYQQEHEEIIHLRELRTQEAIVKIMKMRKELSQAQLQTELVEVLKSWFLPSRRLIKEQLEWLLENGLLKRHSEDINTFTYNA